MKAGWRLAVGIALGAPLALGMACGGGSPSSNTTSSPPPTPSTTLAPAPAPTPAPGASCPIGLGVPNPSCSKDSPSFLVDVEAAMDRLIKEEPEIFDLNEDRGGGSYRVLSLGRYLVGLIRNLEAKGYCAEWNAEELLVKNTNAFDDAYDVITGDLFIRRGSSAYRGSCYPASFPLSKPPLVPNADCPLGSSREVACGKETPTFLAVIESAIDQLIKERPQLFNSNDVQPGTGNWVKVVDVGGYLQGMREVLKSKGFCSYWDGEEFQTKKDNRLSENYDILTGTEYVRRGEGSYRGTCYPAAF